MRSRTALALALWATFAGGSAAVIACGAFGGSSPGDPPPNEIDGSTDGALDGTLDGAVADGSTGADGATTTPALCPPAPGPSCAPSACDKRPLYLPDAPSWPFEMATDSAYVYWLEQRDPAPIAGYNGDGKARVMRVDRAGVGISPGASVLAVDQQSAEAIALVPPHVYWATWDGPSATSTLHRVVAACTPPSCKEEQVGSVKERITKLVGVGTSALVGLLYDGKIVRFSMQGDGGVNAATTVMTTSKFPGMALTSTHVYGAALLTDKVSRADLSNLQLSPAWVTLGFDGGDLGLTQLATNCSDLFGFHGGDIHRVALGDGGVSPVVSLNRAVYGVAADAKYLYVASLNGGGVVAVNPATKSVDVIADGSAWSVAVDDVGVYWGDHASGGGGTITMLVKK